MFILSIPPVRLFMNFYSIIFLTALLTSLYYMKKQVQLLLEYNSANWNSANGHIIPIVPESSDFHKQIPIGRENTGKPV